MTREERLELLKQIEKDIHVCSLESTLLDDAKSCAIHSAIEELEQEPTAKNNLGIDCISRDSAIKALDYDIKSFDFKSGVSEHMDDIAKLLNTIYEIQVNNIKAMPPVTPQPRWIPVSERLPEDYETVIASNGHEYVYPETRYSKEYGWQWAYESGMDYWEDLKGVDAWMPLPQPYREVEK